MIPTNKKTVEKLSYEKVLSMIEAQGEMLKIAEEALEDISLDCHPNNITKDTIFHNKRALETIQSIRKMREKLK